MERERGKSIWEVKERERGSEETLSKLEYSTKRVVRK